MAPGTKWTLFLLAGAGVIALAYWKRAEIVETAGPLGEIVVTGIRRVVSRVISTATRGFRNNNPLNIRKGQNWQGEASVSNDTAFETYAAPEYGFRAATKIFDSYGRLYGATTIAAIVSRWAPTHENPTEQYIRYVEEKMSLSRNEFLVLSAESTTVALLDAMTRFENNGLNPYDYAVMAAGVRMARGQEAYA